MAISPVIALVEDDSKVRQALARLLASYGYNVAEYENGDSFLSGQSPLSYDAIVLDLHMMGDLQGMEVLEVLSESVPKTPVIILTAHDEENLRRRAFDLGVVAYLIKPIDEFPLIGAIRSALGGTD